MSTISVDRNSLNRPDLCGALAAITPQLDGTFVARVFFGPLMTTIEHLVQDVFSIANFDVDFVSPNCMPPMDWR